MIATWNMRRRLMLGFAVFALVVAALFGAYAIVFMYVVEDQFFSDALQSEADDQRAHRARTGRWMTPRSDYMTMHEDPMSFPADLRARFVQASTRTEYPGDDGRHYHVLRLAPASATDPPAFIVAEVSRQLVVRRMRNDILQLLAWTALAVVLSALMAGYWLARRATAPLAALAQRVEAMQPDSLPETFAPQYSTPEVAVLARGLESLVARVHAFVVRERTFTRDASHELRTPLAVIHSACERLTQEASLSVEARRQLDFVRQSVWQLQQTVTTLLSLAREENAAPPAESVMVLPVLERVIVEQAVLLDGKAVEVTVEVPRETRITLPPAVLSILLANLVGNAFAHTHAGTVRIDVSDGRLRIANTFDLASSVSDLSQPFVKGEASSGYGLGLAIVRRLCDHHRIDLRIDSDANGTTASLAVDLASAML